MKFCTQNDKFEEQRLNKVCKIIDISIVDSELRIELVHI